MSVFNVIVFAIIMLRDRLSLFDINISEAGIPEFIFEVFALDKSIHDRGPNGRGSETPQIVYAVKWCVRHRD